MRRHLPVLIPILSAALLAVACAVQPALPATPAATTAPTLIPPDADTPAAGICAETDSEWVTFTVSLEVPDPRCWQVRPSQRLEIANPTAAAVVVTFAGRDIPTDAGATARIDEPFGSYLAPGVHFIYVTQGAGNLPEFWLLPE